VPQGYLAERVPPELLALGDALDMPPELEPIQDAYWQARREWVELQFCFLRVMEHMLAERTEDSPVTGESAERVPR